MSPATCPSCGQHRTVFVRRGDDLVCLDCERALAELCTCESYGHCEVCR